MNTNIESIVNDDVDYSNDADYKSDDEPNPCGQSLGVLKSKKKIIDMDFEELKDYTTKMMENKKRYIRKYQKSDKGKAKIKIASKKFYDKNREKILEKKRLAYLKKKQIKMGIIA